MKNTFSRKHFLPLMSSAILFSSILFLASSCTKDTGIKPSNNIVTENRIIQNISKVNIEDAITVYISKGNEESLYIETSDNILKYVETVTKGTSLTIEWRDGHYYDSKINVYLTLKNLDELEVSGASRVYADSIFNTSFVSIDLSGASFLETTSLTTTSVSIDLSGASEFSGNIYSSRLEADISGASYLKLQGKTNHYDIEMSGASSVNDLNFETDDLICKLGGASSLRVKVNKTLSIEASGASKLIYTGDGAIIHQKITGGSTVRKD